MLNYNLQEIPSSNIEALFIEETSKKGLNSKIKLLKQVKRLDLPLIVEKDIKENKYWLIAGYPEFEAYNKCDFELVPCYVQPYSSKTEQRLSLLRRIFQYQDNTWIEKHIQLHELISYGKSIKEIAKRLGLSESDIIHYLIHPDIPNYIVEQAFAFKRSFPNLEKIRRLLIHNFIKDRLYQELVEGNLTGDMIQKLKWLFANKKFALLCWEKQWKFIDEKVIHYKECLMSMWEKEIEYQLTVSV